MYYDLGRKSKGISYTENVFVHYLINLKTKALACFFEFYFTKYYTISIGCVVLPFSSLPTCFAPFLKYHCHLARSLVHSSHSNAVPQFRKQKRVNCVDNFFRSRLIVFCFSVTERLQEACHRGDDDTVREILLTAIGKEVINDGGRVSDPPLHKASRNGYIDVVKILIRYRAEIDSVDGNGRTALQHASERGHTEVVECLLDKGANPNIKDRRSGWTSLHAAAHYGRTEVTELLLAHGADPEERSFFGKKTPLQIAMSQNHEEVARILRESQ